MGFFGLMIAVSLVVWAFQALLWLKTGHWPPVEMRVLLELFGYEVPQTDWHGLQMILNWLFQLPLTLGLMAAGALAFYLGEERK